MSRHMIDRPRKITFGQMRAAGHRELIVYCADYHCSHNIRLPAAIVDKWADDVQLFDIEANFICSICGKRGAIIRTPPPTDQTKFLSCALRSNNGNRRRS
jgi:hypothetical protein